MRRLRKYLSPWARRHGGRVEARHGGVRCPRWPRGSIGGAAGVGSRRSASCAERVWRWCPEAPGTSPDEEVIRSSIEAARARLGVASTAILLPGGNGSATSERLHTEGRQGCIFGCGGRHALGTTLCAPGCAWRWRRPLGAPIQERRISGPALQDPRTPLSGFLGLAAFRSRRSCSLGRAPFGDAWAGFGDAVFLPSGRPASRGKLRAMSGYRGVACMRGRRRSGRGRTASAIVDTPTHLIGDQRILVTSACAQMACRTTKHA